MFLTRVCRIVAIVACVAAGPVAAVYAGSGGGQAPPRDLRPGEPRPPTARETELRKTLAATPGDVAARLELGKLQESRGAIADAESTLADGRRLDPSNATITSALAALQIRLGQFDRAIATLEAAAATQPSAESFHLIGSFYLERSKETTLSSDERLALLQRGIAAEDRALSLRADYLEALVYKNILLRTQAGLETDAVKRDALIAEADALRNRALELRKSGAAAPAGPHGMAPGAPPPPPPPPPPPRPPKG